MLQQVLCEFYTKSCNQALSPFSVKELLGRGAVRYVPEHWRPVRGGGGKKHHLFPHATLQGSTKTSLPDTQLRVMSYSGN